MRFVFRYFQIFEQPKYTSNCFAFILWFCVSLFSVLALTLTQMPRVTKIKLLLTILNQGLSFCRSRELYSFDARRVTHSRPTENCWEYNETI